MSNQIKCVDCPAEREGKPAKVGGFKTPKTWRKIEGGFRCAKCQAKQFVGRSIRVRILAPVQSEQDQRDRAEMYRALDPAGKQSGMFGNYLLQKLLAADLTQIEVIRGLKINPRTGKPMLPPAPQVDWYQEATKLFPQIAPASLTAQAQMVQRYYAKERFACLAAMNRNVRSYRWDGLPVVISAQAWKLIAIEDDKIVLRTQIGPGKSWTLNVHAEGENLQRMRQIASGEVIPGTASFVRRAREPRPGETKRVRVWYLRISAQVPRANRKNKSHKELTLTLGHDGDSLLFGTLDEGDEVFEYPGIELRKSVVKHQRLDRRRQIDSSFRLAGWSKRKAKRWNADRTAACEKRNEKTAAEIALAAASLVRWCGSHHVTAVDYDITPRGFLDKFPWRALRDRIECSLQNAGIAIHVEGAEPTNEQEDSQVAFAGPGHETGEGA